MDLSWRNMAEDLLFILGILALVYAMMISSDVINSKEANLMLFGFQRKKTMIAVHAVEKHPVKSVLHRT